MLIRALKKCNCQPLEYLFSLLVIFIKIGTVCLFNKKKKQPKRPIRLAFLNIHRAVIVDPVNNNTY